jgi:alkylation response protein AidB-like acyl-CoA dehydrogenase
LTTEEQRHRWLPKFCTGEIITAIAMTEPTGGSDLAALKTTAVKDGATWVINGSKTCHRARSRPLTGRVLLMKG